LSIIFIEERKRKPGGSGGIDFLQELSKYIEKGGIDNVDAEIMER
jgi:hypothetical protein